MKHRRVIFPAGRGSDCNASAPLLSARASLILHSLMLLVVTGFSVNAAASDRDQERARTLSSSGAIVPLEQITAQVRTRNIKQILEVELESDEDEHHYEVEVIDAAGVVRKLRYDAVTGELQSDRPDD